jgi:hypothetical protein
MVSDPINVAINDLNVGPEILYGVTTLPFHIYADLANEVLVRFVDR